MSGHQQLVMPGEDPYFADAARTAKKQKCLSRCICVLVIVIILTGAFALGLGLSYNLVVQDVQDMVAQQVILTNGSQGTDNWADAPAPIYAEFTFFNITNVEEVRNGAKPNIEVVKPIRYIEKKVKHHLLWNDDETIVRYNKTTTYHYIDDDDNLSPNAKITTVNLPYIGVLLQLQKLSEFANTIKNPLVKTLLVGIIADIQNVLNTTFKEQLFFTKTANELLWGYQDELLRFIADVIKDIGIPISLSLPPGGKFALQTNDTNEGPTLVFTGKNNPKVTAKFIMWDGQTSMSKWGTPLAGMINGTEGTLFHPGVTTEDKLYIFVDQLFRSGYFTYNKPVKNNGLNLYRFTLPAEELSNTTQDPGFYPYGPSGVLNLTAVFPLNVPIFVSKPLFLDADPYYASLVTGLPDPKKDRDSYDSFLDVEPMTGGVLNAAKRLQINLELKQHSGYPALQNLQKHTLLPVFVATEAGGINSTLGEKFQQQIYTPVYTVDYGALGVAGLSGFICIVCILLLFVLCVYRCEVAVKNRRRNGEIAPLLQNTY